ncbi:unnamed protein product [Symbiodinium sp. CCMP2592]|nr:unnamed protein product [Symbiodinium sp. CCMP2592]
MARLEPAHPMWPQVKETLRRCAEDRESIIHEVFQTSTAHGKKLLNKIFNGGAPPEHLASQDFVLRLQKAAMFCRWTCVSVSPEVFGQMVEDEDRSHPEASTLFFIWSAVEDLIISAWLEKIQEQQPSHVSLHFDGIRVDQAAVGSSVEAFCVECASHIKSRTGFDVSLRPKSHQTFLEGIRVGSASRDAESIEPATLTDEGNCILCALHRLGHTDAAGKMLGDTDSEAAVYFRRRRHRTYLQVVEATQVTLTPWMSSTEFAHMPLEGNFLIHLTKNNKPHCVGLRADTPGNFIVMDGNATFTIQNRLFWNAFAAAIDSRHVVFFQVWEDPAAWPNLPGSIARLEKTEVERLLELQACAGDDSSRDIDDDNNREFEQDNEAVTHVGDVLLRKLSEEIDAVAADRRTPRPDASGRARCPLCPFRSWSRHNACRVLVHIRKHHTSTKQYSASGTKQIKLVLALHDQDKLEGMPAACNYLRRSADMIRDTVRPPLSSTRNSIDKKIRLVFTQDGPEYWNLEATISAGLRRSRNLYYNLGFAQKIFQKTILNNAKEQDTLHALNLCPLQFFPTMTAMKAEISNRACSLFPSHSKDWWPLIEDIFSSPHVRQLGDQLIAECVQHKEMRCLSIDATMRCCMPLLGQARIKASPIERAEVITVRGRTNAVVVMRAAQAEDSDTAAYLLAETLPAAALGQIMYVSVDNPSRKYFSTLKSLCPNLQGMSLDTVHLAMTCEYGSARRRTGATKALRRVLAKFAAVDTAVGPEAFGKIFSGGKAKHLTAEEERFRRHVEDRSMRQHDAQRLLNELDDEKPIYTRLEWIQLIAAVANVFRDDMTRLCPGPNKRVWQLLLGATSPERSEWYLNNLRIRHSLHARALPLLPVGTTSNESLHAEINRWFKETQMMHQATLEMKLEILRLGKLLSHNRALYHTTSCQMTHAEVLARATRQCLWTEGEWAAWCSELEDGEGAKMKAHLPFHEARETQKSIVRGCRKRPASAPSARSTVRRTPHTLERQDSFKRGGRRSCH